MNALRFCSLVLVGVLAGAGPLPAQTPAARDASPRIGYIYPAGGTQGGTVLAHAGGQSLGGVTTADFFGPGVTARIVQHHRPLTQKQFQDLREEADRLQAKRALAQTATAKAAATGVPTPGPTPSPTPAPAAATASAATTAAAPPPVAPWTAADEARAAELRAMIGYRVNRQLAPAIAEGVALEISIAPDAPPGPRELRLRSPDGASNPLTFWIGTLPEFSETPAHPNTAPPVERNATTPEPRARPTPARTVTLPATVNGQILPGEVDRVTFHATAGQHLVAAASARSLIPYIADAVPGWFQAVLLLRDAKGREVAFSDDTQFNPDPTLLFTVPSDGDYVLEIRDSIYRGRQDFIYRIALGELPHISRLFPLGGSVGRTHEVELIGWNLKSTRAIVDGRERQPGMMEFSCQSQGLPSNTVLFAFDRDPELTETEPGPASDHAQPVTLPIIVNGQIQSSSDIDAFSFPATTGVPVVIEVIARRLNSPLDSLLQLVDPEGRVVARSDDVDDKGAGLWAHQADSRLLYTPAKTGVHTVRLSDTQHRGGVDYGYRLHVREARPDFELRVVPSTLNIRAGVHQPITVYALRRDGFQGPIELGLQGDQGALGMSGGVIPAGADQVRLTLVPISNPKLDSFRLTVLGRATVNGRTEIRDAVPCEDMMQAFAYRHLVPSRQLRVTWVTNPKLMRPFARLLDRPPLRFRGATPVRVRCSIPGLKMLTHAQAELGEGADGFTVKETHVVGETVEITLVLDPAKVKPGTQGNLLLRVSGERDSTDRKKSPNRVRLPAVLLPAVAFEVVDAT